MYSKKFKTTLLDIIVDFIGSWKFILIQSTVLVAWITVNALNIIDFDPYPFITLKLLLSFQAAYLTPLILMASNCSANKDRKCLSQALKLSEQTNSHVDAIFEQIETIAKELQDIKRSLRSLKN